MAKMELKLDEDENQTWENNQSDETEIEEEGISPGRPIAEVSEGETVIEELLDAERKEIEDIE